MIANRTRPLGVTIIASVVLIMGLFGLCGGVTGLLGASFNILQLDIKGLFSDSFRALLTIILSLAYFAVAFGLFNLAKWAFWVTVLVQGLAVLNGLQGGFFGLFSVIIPLCVVAYLLLNSNVRNAFRT